MSTETARAFAKENSLSFIETSAKLEGPEGNVEKAFTTIVTGSYLSFPTISAPFAFSYPRTTSFLFRISHHHDIETQLKRLKSGVRCRSPFALCSPHNTDKPPLELKNTEIYRRARAAPKKVEDEDDGKVGVEGVVLVQPPPEKPEKTCCL